MTTLPEQAQLNALISAIFRIDDITVGDGKEYYYRYRGLLTAPDSAVAYDQLAEALVPYQLTPLFRKSEDGDGHLILLIASQALPKPSDPMKNLIMFALTVVSVFLSGALYEYMGTHPNLEITDFSQAYILAFQNFWNGWPFAVSLLSILLAHEFGHYLVGRLHKMALTLPYFIPIPFPGGIGTMGAVIQLKELPKNKRVLLDVGIAGPLAGLIVAIPVLLIGLRTSPLTHHLTETIGYEGNSILYLFLKYVTFGQMLPTPASYSLPPFLHWLVYFFTGTPAPVGGSDVLLNQVAWAGWIGLLVTSLNLLPAGQLDGGHILYVLLGGKRLRGLLPYIQAILAILSIFSFSWWLFLLLISFFGRITDQPRDQITELNPARRVLAIFGVIIFLIVFMPIPFTAPIYSLFAPQ